MRRNIRLLIVGLLLCALLSACGHQHAWLDATCSAPKTCIDCGATEGVAKEHTWQDATCSAPKTCADCSTTEGAALAHIYDQWGEREQDPSGQWIHSRSCTLCGELQTEQTKGPTIRTDLGSAGFPDGTTIIVSIFANELSTGWNFDNEADREARAIMLSHMGSAASWLTQQITAYGADPRFIYDWEANPDLCYTYDFGQQMLVRSDGGGYWTQADYIQEHIPTEALKEKYKAQNIIYMFYFNTDENNKVSSWSLGNIQNLNTEIINIFVRNYFSTGFYYETAPSFAHEIMHCFGAYDLYYASATISQAYVDHCRLSDSQDIMYTSSLGAEIPQIFSQLDAYYMGLVDQCDEVEQWGLGKSTFLK